MASKWRKAKIALGLKVCVHVPGSAENASSTSLDDAVGRFLDEVSVSPSTPSSESRVETPQTPSSGLRLSKTESRSSKVVPHITDAIQEWIERVAVVPVDGLEGPPDVCVIELGGTIGDIEYMPFIVALGQFSYCVGPGNFCLVHVNIVPVLNVVGEQKTKSTQHSVRGLRELGHTPNILACRSAKALEENVIEKLLKFFHVPTTNIITLYDVSNIWHIPLLLKVQNAHKALLKGLNLLGVEPSLEEWMGRAKLCDKLENPVRIGMVGKYTGLQDSYLSVLKAPLHASLACRRKLVLKGAHGVLVHGGFGDRGVEGKLPATKYARENSIPFFGICLGCK